MSTYPEYITVEAARRAGACAEGLEWLSSQDRPVTVLDVPDPEWRRWAVHSLPDHCTPYLAALAQDESEWVRAAVAELPDAGPYLAALAQDEAWRVRRAVASHPDAGPYLAALAQDGSAGVRAVVAARPDAKGANA